MPKKKDVASRDKYADKAKKRRKLLNKLKLDRHHKMERFTVIVGTLGVCFALNLVVSGYHSYNATTQLKSDKAIYTEIADFSKTGTEVTMNGVYRSSDDKTAFVVFSLEDLNSMSLNGKNYNLYILGYKDKLKSNTLTARYFVFGSTGLMGLMLYDSNGLPNQILDVVVRANKTIVASPSKESVYGEDSFNKYNQMRLFVNPGAKGATKMSQLGSNIDKELLYYFFIGKQKEKEVLDEWKNSLQEEQLLRTQISEYVDRIESAGYELPEKPEWAKRNYMLPDGFRMDNQYTLNPDHGHTSYMDAWFDGDVNEYLDQEKDLADNQQKTYEKVAAMYEVKNVLMNKDGTSLDISMVSDGDSDSRDVQVMRDYQSLNGAYTKLLSLKQTQQYTLPDKLLKIESIQIDQAKHFSWGDTNKAFIQHSK